MEITYQNVTGWFDEYFKAFNRYVGPLETVPNMQRYFAPDLEFWPFNMAGTKSPSSREELLMIMVHPGLHEEFTPREYIVDLERMVVVVQLQLQFNDELSGKVWPAKQASAHYHLVMDENNDLKIKKIVYFTEPTSPEEAASQKEAVPMMELWRKYREKALAELATRWIDTQARGAKL
ncbi:MAG: hypothetical protein JXA46_07195 [Dehalococcoidales bacterium]|nr:hypothetical protein [Dehalococcoidales bacterium]